MQTVALYAHNTINNGNLMLISLILTVTNNLHFMIIIEHGITSTTVVGHTSGTWVCIAACGSAWISFTVHSGDTSGALVFMSVNRS